MSVINQMLRDLEARKEKKAHSSHYIDEVNIIAHSKPSVYRWIIPVFIMLLVSVAVFFYAISTQSRTEYPQSTVADLPANISQVNQAETIVPASTVEEKLWDKSESQSPAEVIAATSEPNAVVIQNAINTIQPTKTAVSNTKEVNRPAPEPVVLKTVDEKKIKLLPPKTSLSDSKTKTAVLKIEPVRKDKTEDKALALMSRARVLMASDVASAVKILEDNLKAVKENADYYSLLANFYQRQQRYDEAIVYYRKALKIRPEQGELWIGIALAYRSNGEYDNERQAFQQALQSRKIRPELLQYAARQLKRNSAR